MDIITKEIPDKAYLMECFVYDKDTGVLRWKARPVTHFRNAKRMRLWNGRYAGTKAMAYVGTYGYLQGTLNNIPHKAHRIVWKLVYGSDAMFIDHINGDKSDNSITNLRSVTHSQNKRNTAVQKNNTSGVTGVSRHTQQRGWMVDIYAEKGEKHTKYFQSFDDAVAYRKECEVRYGYHQNHGRAKP